MEEPLYQRCKPERLDMNTLFILTEEESLRTALDVILPKLIDPSRVSYQVIAHDGKQDLETAIRRTVPSLSRIPGARIIVTRDQDAEDCLLVKKHLQELVMANCNAPYKIRVLCHELENWFLGDFEAISAAFPRFRPDQVRQKAKYRNVDNLANAPQELLKIIPELAGRAYLSKINTASMISPHLNTERNTSLSFQNFVRAVEELTTGNLE